jgi:hypothetical protein
MLVVAATTAVPSHPRRRSRSQRDPRRCRRTAEQLPAGLRAIGEPHGHEGACAPVSTSRNRCVSEVAGDVAGLEERRRAVGAVIGGGVCGSAVRRGTRKRRRCHPGAVGRTASRGSGPPRSARRCLRSRTIARAPPGRDRVDVGEAVPLVVEQLHCAVHHVTEQHVLCCPTRRSSSCPACPGIRMMSMPGSTGPSASYGSRRAAAGSIRSWRWR